MGERYHRGRLSHARAMVRQPEPRDSRSMDTVVWADRMFVNIVSYFFGFIVFFAVSCLLLRNLSSVGEKSPLHSLTGAASVNT